MTALLLDLGNTRWKMARAEGANIASVLSGDYVDLADLGTAALRDAEAIDSIWLASVVDAGRTRSVVSALQESVGIPVRQVISTDPMPNLVSGYLKPEQLGIDRLMAMVAARACSPQPLCVVDAGTAVTIDFVDQTGQHLGGFILPGRRMFRECLLANTSIPRDNQVDAHAVLGRDTPTAVALAARYAISGIVEHFIAGQGALFAGVKANIYVGGGDADHLLALLPRPCTKLDDLVLRGLAVMAAGGVS
jgi:type III pantothenate kinase